MSENFDPYYAWLGIPPEEQPPDHYRLLGIRRFESNVEAISNAVNQRMAHIRSYETGSRAEYSQTILTEISSASDCLLSLEKKGAYDRELRQKDAPKLSKSGPLSTTRPVSFSKPRPHDLATTTTAPLASFLEELLPMGPGDAPPPGHFPPSLPRSTVMLAGIPTKPPKPAAESESPRPDWWAPALIGLGVVAVLGLITIAGLFVVAVGSRMLTRSDSNGNLHPKEASSRQQPSTRRLKSPPPAGKGTVKGIIGDDEGHTAGGIDSTGAIEIVGKAESSLSLKSRPRRPDDMAAIRAADVDRGKSLRASADPAEIAEIVGEVAPGFTAGLPVVPGGVAIVAEHFGRKRVLSTHPLDPARPCILASKVDVPANMQTTLTFDVSHSRAGDWQVIVLANDERLYDAPVGPKTAKNGWLAVSVDLTRFAGQRVVLELHNKATGYSHEWGFWDNVRLTARKRE